MALRQPNTEMRLKYLASERGEKLSVAYTGNANATSAVGATGETFGATRANDSGVAQAGGASLATIAARYAGIDASISAAT
jgi:hypothetical protein